MDCMYPNLMAREDLVRILKQRELKIPNIDNLSHEELTKIFCKFAVPLGRRADKDFNSSDCSPSTNTADKIKMCNGKTNYLKRNLPSSDNHSNIKREKIENNDITLDSKKRVIANNTENTKNKKQKIYWP